MPHEPCCQQDDHSKPDKPQRQHGTQDTLHHANNDKQNDAA